MRTVSLSALLALALFAAIVTGCARWQKVKLPGTAGLSQAQSALLQVPAEAEVQAVDGVPVQFSAQNVIGVGIELFLPPGPHTVTVIYSDMITTGEERFQEVSSDPVTLEFNVEPGTLYRVMLEKPRSLRAAKAFADDPVFSVERMD